MSASVTDEISLHESIALCGSEEKPDKPLSNNLKSNVNVDVCTILMSDSTMCQTDEPNVCLGRPATDARTAALSA